MALNDVYRAEWATEYDGGSAVTSLFYKQVSAILGEPDNVAQTLIDALFVGTNAPYQLIQNKLGSGLQINVARVQRMRPVPGLIESASVSFTGSSANPSLPMVYGATYAWGSNTNPTDLVSNRIFIPGWTLESVRKAGFNANHIAQNLLFFPTLRNLQPVSGPVLFDLQFRRNTGGNEEDVVYEDASAIMMRSFATRIGSRSMKVI